MKGAVLFYASSPPAVLSLDESSYKAVTCGTTWESTILYIQLMKQNMFSKDLNSSVPVLKDFSSLMKAYPVLNKSKSYNEERSDDRVEEEDEDKKG
ncbi:hypothetical protein K1719_015283 [Acacia pycnantha]|nr:hypothetical protein K1719_015283 [Acacia pycnantha]